MNAKQTVQSDEKWPAAVSVVAFLVMLCLSPFLYDLYSGWIAK